MSSPSEPSILEYARFHNIANKSIQDPLLLIPPLLEGIDVSLCDRGSLSVDLDGIHREIQARTIEKLDARWASAHLLSSILKSSIAEIPTSNNYEESEYPPDSDQIQNFKIDTPILRTDHEMDMLVFRRRISLDFMEMDVPLEHLDDESDESLKFPSGFWTQPKRVLDMVQGERLRCMKEGLILMQGIKSQIVEAGKPDIDDWLDEGIIFCGKKVVNPQTPILLPRDPTPIPFIPSSPCLEMEILPGPETPPMVQPQGSEDTLMPNCGQIVTKFLAETNDVEGPQMLAGGLNEVAQDSSGLTLSPVVKNRILDLKVETPITPPISTKNRVAENDEDILDAMARTGVVPVPEIPSHDPMETEQEDWVEEDLAEVVSGAKKNTDDEVNGERIRGINITTRCKVPFLKSPIIVPPWPALDGPTESELRGLYQSFISDIKNLSGLRYAAGEYSKKDLKWQPFAMEVGKLDIKESITTGDAWSGFLLDIGRLSSGSENEFDSFISGYHYDFQVSSLDDDEELVPQIICEEIQPVSSLQGQGHQHDATMNEMEVYGLGHPYIDKLHKIIDNQTESINATKVEIDLASSRGKRASSTLLSVFTPLDSLSNFMELRGRIPIAAGSDICPSFSHHAPGDLPVLAKDTENPRINAHPSEMPTQPNPKIIRIPLLVAPNTPCTQNALTFVVSTSLLQTHRAIIHKLECLSPECNLIFRDYGTRSSSHALSNQAQNSGHPHLIPRTQHYLGTSQKNEEQEADISCSPTVGVLLTTPQEITQKYLPGHQPNGQGISQEPNTPVRQRISNICLLYEELYVFICNPIINQSRHNLTVPYAEMDDRTVKAVNSLRAFCESLSHFSTITVFLVTNDAVHITDWLVSLANKHYTATPWSTSNIVHKLGRPDLFLLAEDPSPSELFLRQSGLNTFAAQLMLLHLYEDRDDENGLCYPGKYSTREAQNPQTAISRFVRMSPFERRRIFTPILGQRVLERVERRLVVEQR